MDQGRRKDRDTEPTETPEGVRILGADEAVEALERGDVARRRTGDELRYGDRPPGPPEDGPRPVLRFPLGSSDDPRDIERTPLSDAGSGGEPGPGDRGEAPRRVEGPAEEDHAEGPNGPLSAGLVAGGPVSGPVELPHWTDPPTGQVPPILGGEPDDRDDRRDDDRDDARDDDLEDWASFAASSPRWRDDTSGYGDDDDLGYLTGGEAPVGALDDSERPSHEEYLSFADLDEAVPKGRSVFADVDEDFFEDDRTAVGWADEGVPGWPGEADEAYEEPLAAPEEDRPLPPARRPRSRRPAAHAPDVGPPVERDIGMAVVVVIGLSAVALFLFSIGPAAAMILVTAIVGLAAAELFTALRRAGFQPVVLAGLAGTVGMLLGAYNYGVGAIPTVLVLTTAVCLLWYLVGAAVDNPVMNTGVTLFGVLWVGMFGAFAALMLNLGEPGIGILLAAIIGTAGYDVGGLFIGRQGRRPLSPASPNKTVEGLFGGCLVAVAVVVIGAVSVGFGPIDSFGEGLMVGLAVAFAAPLGDLSESLVKRDLGVKDMGAILPGHGGLLDRFDGLLFVLPTVYLLASVSNFFV
jgi:phosphatidate cytidylyltransferase